MLAHGKKSFCGSGASRDDSTVSQSVALPEDSVVPSLMESSELRANRKRTLLSD